MSTYKIIKWNLKADDELNIDTFTKSFNSLLDRDYLMLFHLYISHHEFYDKELVVKLKRFDHKINHYKLMANVNPHNEKQYILTLVNVESEIKLLEETKRRHKSEQQLSEQAKLAQMGEMIANIAHQWRQPLSMISITATGILFKEEQGVYDYTKLKDELESINDQAQYLSKTIDTFRNYLKEKKEKKIVVLQDRMQIAFNIIDINLKNNHIELQTNINEVPPIQYELVLGELTQILINIINNAKDALNEKNPKERWVKVDLNKNDTNILITIEDSAGGVPENIIDKIFNPYFTTKHQTHGTGLGLHMTHKIVTESLGGTVDVKNTDSGALFTIKLLLQ